MNMTDEEIKLRNISIEDKLKEMEENLEKLKITNKELLQENTEINEKLLKNGNKLKGLKYRCVPKSQSIRYLTILYAGDLYKLSANSTTQFDDNLIFAQYQFGASMNYKRALKFECDKVDYNFSKDCLPHILNIINDFNPIVTIPPKLDN